MREKIFIVKCSQRVLQWGRLSRNPSVIYTIPYTLFPLIDVRNQCVHCHRIFISMMSFKEIISEVSKNAIKGKKYGSCIKFIDIIIELYISLL